MASPRPPQRPIADAPARVKQVAILTLLLVACTPAAFVVTFLLFPFWAWVEATYGIEAVGHSGPSDWCFWLTFGVLSASTTATLVRYYRR